VGAWRRQSLSGHKPRATTSSVHGSGRVHDIVTPRLACDAVAMRRGRDRGREARLREFFQGLSPIQRGVVICVLLANALLVVTVDSVVIVATIRGAIRSWRYRRVGPWAAIRTGIGPALCAALAAMAIQWLVAYGLIRAVETGRATAWLERIEHRLAAGAEDQDSGP
jgi:ABC-type Fe3+ transport system permease subunit